MSTAAQTQALLPVYRWRQAPAGLATRTQLRKQGLRPGGQDVVGEIRWRSKLTRGEWRSAWLYLVDQALPVRPMTEGRRRALEAAMRARRTCPTCKTDVGYVIPTSLGCCVLCADQH
ncbi:hypothetical protein Kpho02_72950 [Kitasatospora phosalacinea]|uniref:Uncharacterized protein n=1 Tax=Kitasatospora phosalacinea TaxID=2065 RepID=A0A9W6QHE9_9ACTN|nr:RRQRL motif-containing zinc-binding protein [Kitasatospora phosalacinea]GLW74998.1 hypothetical protein Kpho02_72950 [Kitasatospora phosalacinea]